MKAEAEPALVSGDFRTFQFHPKHSGPRLHYNRRHELRGNERRTTMRFPGSILIGSLLILGLLSHGIVLMQLSHNPERGHRGPAETFRAVQFSGADSDILTLTAAAGFELLDPRPW